MWFTFFFRSYVPGSNDADIDRHRDSSDDELLHNYDHSHHHYHHHRNPYGNDNIENRRSYQSYMNQQKVIQRAPQQVSPYLPTTNINTPAHYNMRGVQIPSPYKEYFT